MAKAAQFKIRANPSLKSSRLVLDGQCNFKWNQRHSWSCDSIASNLLEGLPSDHFMKPQDDTLRGTDTASVAVSCTQVVKRFGALTALDGVSLTIPRGTCYALLGPNGAGKTTLARIISAISRPDAGHLEVLGLDPWHLQTEVKSRIGNVMQDEVFDEDLNVQRNLEIHGLFFGLSGTAFREKIRAMLAFVQLDGREKMPIQALSGGMRRRLMIARALLNDPDLLVLDEPTTGLDPQVRHSLWAALRTLRNHGITVLLTTHYIEEAAHLAQRVGILHKGKLIAEDTPEGLIGTHLPAHVCEFDLQEKLAALDHPLPGAVIEKHGDRGFLFLNAAEVLQRWVSEHGLRSAQVRHASLEDVFLKLTGRTLEE